MNNDRELLEKVLYVLENRVPYNEVTKALRERLAQPEQEPVCAHGVEKTKCDFCSVKDKQPGQSPLDRMAENARELGLDYEPKQEPVAWNLRYNRYPREGDLLADIHLLRWRESLPQSLNAPPRCPNCASLEAQNTALDAKLAEMERGEPVATVQSMNGLLIGYMEKMLPEGTPLYTTPQRREWVGLTDEDIYGEGRNHEKFARDGSEWFDRGSFARAIEAKLREKNA